MPENVRDNFFVEEPLDRVDQPFARLQSDITVKPSQTITSALPLCTPRASTFPMKLSEDAFTTGARPDQLGALALLLTDGASRCAGARYPAIPWRTPHPSPRTAARCVERHSTFARRRAGSRACPRRNRGRQRRTIGARQHPEDRVGRQHRRAGVTGVTIAAASPLATASAATRMDARGLRRKAAEGASSIEMTSGASRMRML